LKTEKYETSWESEIHIGSWSEKQGTKKNVLKRENLEIKTFFLSGGEGLGNKNSSQTDVQCETENDNVRFELRDIFKIL
jgi:hypothetical protein